MKKKPSDEIRMDKFNKIVECYHINLSSNKEEIYNAVFGMIDRKYNLKEIEYLMGENGKIAIRYSHEISFGIPVDLIKRMESELQNCKVDYFVLKKVKAKYFNLLAKDQEKLVEKYKGSFVQIRGSVYNYQKHIYELQDVKGIYLDFDNNIHKIINTHGNVVKVNDLSKKVKIKELSFNSPLREKMYDIYFKYKQKIEYENTIKDFTQKINKLNMQTIECENDIKDMKRDIMKANPDYVMSKNEFVEELNKILSHSKKSMVSNQYYLSVEPGPYMEMNELDSKIYLIKRIDTLNSRFVEFNYEGVLTFKSNICNSSEYKEFIEECKKKYCNDLDIPNSKRHSYICSSQGVPFYDCYEIDLNKLNLKNLNKIADVLSYHSLYCDNNKDVLFKTEAIDNNNADQIVFDFDFSKEYD